MNIQDRLVFVEVPNNVTDLSVDNYRHVISGDEPTLFGEIDWFSPQLPSYKLRIVTQLEELTEDQLTKANLLPATEQYKWVILKHIED